MIYCRTHNFQHLAAVSENEVQVIALIIAITLLWFPMRVYSDWYQNFYSLESFSTYYLFWQLIALAVFAVVGLILIQVPDNLIKIVSYAAAFLTFFSDSL
jgi:hypothetical protein